MPVVTLYSIVCVRIHERILNNGLREHECNVNMPNNLSELIWADKMHQQNSTITLSLFPPILIQLIIIKLFEIIYYDV